MLDKVKDLIGVESVQKWLSKSREGAKTYQIYQRLAKDNQEAIDDYNQKTLATLLPIGWALTLLPLAAVPFSNTKINAVPAYLATFFAYFGLFFLYKLPSMKKYTLLGLHLIFSVFFLFGTYLSVIHSPHMRATILLGGFILMPISFIDNPRRTKFVLAFWLIFTGIMAFHFKPQYALDDAINSISAAVLGYFVGKMMVHVRLESFEARRQLIIEKETDVLTGLFNRRKLFETLIDLEAGRAEKPTGIMMIDIDFFKGFNDSYGHLAGDRHLSNLGETLGKYSQNFKLKFFRYGGEEFLGLAYGYDAKELYSIAEGLRISMQNTKTDGHSTTVSIGAAHCGDEQVRNYENIIDRADKAAYAAKDAGRNKVCLAEPE
ncbi:MAG: GGDEF domain-containing protein [Firmicutes bacterium]|nr:GGDEF domain-containing protein [Bacillota bacterium]